MNLSVKERIILFGLLPTEGDIFSLRIVRKLRESLSFSEQENRDLQITQVSGTFTWNPAVDGSKDIEIGDTAHKLICGRLKQLDASKALTMDHIDLWDKFIPADGAG